MDYTISAIMNDETIRIRINYTAFYAVEATSGGNTQFLGSLQKRSE